MTRVLVIDNYDSFTWNLVHLLGPLATSVDVVRNDAITTDEVLRHPPDAIVLSPGPCTPNEAGICLDLVKRASPDIPTFGVCLGLQAIGQVFGGTVSRAPLPMHGKVSEVEHRRPDGFSRHQRPVQGDPLPFADRRSRDLPDRSARHGRDVGRSRHGSVAPLAADPRGAVPSREHPVGARGDDHAQFLRTRSGLERQAPRDRRPGRPSRIVRPMESFKSYLAKVATGASLTREEARDAFDDLLSGEVTPAQGGAFLMALRVRGEALDEIVGAVTAMRGRMLRVNAPDEGDRHRRHRRRPHGQLQHLDARLDHRRLLRRSRRQARQPRGVLEIRNGGCALGARREARARSGGPGALPQRDQAVLHVRPDPSRGHAPRGAGPRRARHAHDLQPARPARQSGRRQAPASRRVLRGLARTAHAGSEGTRLRKGLDRARLRRARRDDHDRPDLRGGPGERRDPPLHRDARGGRPSDRYASTSFSGGDPEHNAAQLRAVLDGARTPYRDVSLLNAAASLVIADEAANLRDGLDRASRALDSGASKATLERLVKASNA